MKIKTDQTKSSLWMFWMGLFLLGAFFAWNNALTTSADLARNQVAFKAWHPYVWELSSFISTFILYFGVYWLAVKAPLFKPKWLRNLFIHALGTMIFSIWHVTLMVWLRQLVYFLMDSQYEFGHWLTEWLYEYRKDVVTYFIFVLLLYAYQYFTQPKSERESEREVSSEPEKLQVKNKQGLFWVSLADISTIESGGNYVYIHANDQVLPMRCTMAEMERQLNSNAFVRVHRSYLVNLSYCKGMRKQTVDSDELFLSHGKSVPVSKKYRDDILSALKQKALNNDKLIT